MNNDIVKIAGSLPRFLENTHLTVNLSGWSAAITIIAICASGVAAYAIKIAHPSAKSYDYDNAEAA